VARWPGGQVARWLGGQVARLFGCGQMWPGSSTYGEVVQVRPGRPGAASRSGRGQVRLRVAKSFKCGQVRLCGKPSRCGRAWRGMNVYGLVWPSRPRAARWPGVARSSGCGRRRPPPVSRGPVAGERRHSSRRRPPRVIRPQLRECSAHANSTSVPAPSSQPPWHPSSTHPGTLFDGAVSQWSPPYPWCLGLLVRRPTPAHVSAVTP
jgi:hypothetical protein